MRNGNYEFFIKKIETHVLPVCDILAWCLMPNHFHFLIHANSKSTPTIKDGSFERQNFSQAIKQLLSSYTKAINKQEGRTGSLFQQKTKAICLSRDSDYLFTVFNYIHQNPVKAGLTQKLEDWAFSSFSEYIKQNKFSLCNKEISTKYIGLNMERFYDESYKVINFDMKF